MRNSTAWTGFLVMLFAIVGLCGLFASYADSIPLERGTARSALLDTALSTGAGADGAQRLEQLRPMLGDLGVLVLDGAGPLAERVAKARLVVVDEQRREAASVGYRTRLMLVVVTLLAAGLGAGILALVQRQPSSG